MTECWRAQPVMLSRQTDTRVAAAAAAAAEFQRLLLVGCSCTGTKLEAACATGALEH